MTKLFEDLKAGLEEVDRFLGGETAGFEVTTAADADLKSAGICDGPPFARDAEVGDRVSWMV